MFRQLFLDHPHSVGESYFEHMGVAVRFGVTMIVGGIGAVIHGLLPFAFRTAGSTTVIRLNAVLVEKRAATRDARTIEWMI